MDSLKVDKDDVKKVVGSILGGEEAKELDLEKSHSKFLGMYRQAKRYSIIFDLMWNHDCMEGFNKEKELIQAYAQLIHNEVVANFEQYDIKRIDRSISTYPLIAKDEEENVTTFLKYFNAMKQCSLIHTIINTGNNMVDYKRYIENADKLDDDFLVKSSMMTWEPVQDLAVNFKLLYITIKDARGKTFLMNVFHKLYDITTSMYKERGRVDIDTGAFVRAVHSTVEKLRKEIPRCEEAFKKILESTGILENNYEDYYKDYVGCNNSMVIAENFIQDVATTIDKSPKLAFQFRKIIQHLRKLTNRLTGTDPKYKQTFDTLLNHADKSYKEVEEALVKEGEHVESDSDSGIEELD